MAASHPIQDELEAVLTTVADALQRHPHLGHLAGPMSRLAAQVREPFLLAVVGRVKAGKSTLVNALVGYDLPTVGATETTATINWFRHGPPEDEVRVQTFRSGADRPEVHPLSYLEAFQGDSAETLALIAGIDRLEFRLPSDLLRSLVLVDTPGLNAVAAEHQNRAATFIGLASQLRQRNSDETLRLSREADAVLYVLPPAPAERDLTLLEEFQRTAQGEDPAFNAIALLGKMDWFDLDATNWEGYARDASHALRKVVSGVVPVSVGISDFANHLARNAGALALFTRLIRSVSVAEFEELIDSESHFWNDDGLALTITERRLLLGEHPWTAFKAAAIAGRARRPEASRGVVDDLTEVSGLDQARRMIDEIFVAQGPLLRCHRIARDAEKLLTHPPDGGAALVARLAASDHAERVEMDRYLALIDRVTPTLLPQDRPVAEALRRLVVTTRQSIMRAAETQAILADLSRPIAVCRRTMDEMVSRRVSLKLLSEVASAIPADLADELHRLFSSPSPEARDARRDDPDLRATARARERFWRAKLDLDDRIQTLARRAARAYANLYPA